MQIFDYKSEIWKYNIVNLKFVCQTVSTCQTYGTYYLGQQKQHR